MPTVDETLQFEEIRSEQAADTVPVEVAKHIDAPVEAVFKALTTAESVRQWWGPQGFECPVAKVDPKIGGKYLFEMKSPDGTDLWTTGKFKDIAPNRRIVLSDFPSNSEGEVISPEEAGFRGPYTDIGEATMVGRRHSIN